MHPPARQGSGRVDEVSQRSLLGCIKGKKWSGDAAQHRQGGTKNLRGFFTEEQSSASPVCLQSPRQKPPIKTLVIKSYQAQACLHTATECSRQGSPLQPETAGAGVGKLQLLSGLHLPPSPVFSIAAFPWEHSGGEHYKYVLFVI